MRSRCLEEDAIELLCDNGIASSLVVILDREYLSNGAHSTKPLAHKVAAVASHFASALKPEVHLRTR